MVKWAQFRTVRFVVLSVLILYAGAACSNMFSQVDGGTGDVVFEFRASMLFNETGSAGVPYLIPTAREIRATLVPISAQSTDPDSAGTEQRATLAITASQGIAEAVIEFPSVALNVEYRIDLTIVDDEGRVLHTGSKTVTPITRSLREETVVLRVNEAGVVEQSEVVVGTTLAGLSFPAGTFRMYALRTDSDPDSAHLLTIAGLSPADLDGTLFAILNNTFRRTGFAFEPDNETTRVALPRAETVRYLAVYREPGTDTASLDISLTPFNAPATVDAPAITNATTLTITVTGLAGGTFVYSVDGATTIEATEIVDTAGDGEVTITLADLQDGTNTLSVFVRDADGNESPAATAEIVVDTVPPDMPVITDGPTSPTNNPNPTFTVTGEAGGTFVYTVAGATAIGPIDVPDTGDTGVETITLENLNNGEHTVTVFVRDAAGNEGAAVSFTFEVNTAIPDAPVIVDASGITNATTLTITVTGLEGGTFVYSLAGATTIEATEIVDTANAGLVTITVADLQDGTNTLSVFVRDAAENESPVATADILVDTMPPDAPTDVTSVDLLGVAPDLYILTDTLTITWTEPEPGVTYEISTDDGMTWNTIGTVPSHTLTLPGTGQYAVRVRATDLAGNISLQSEPALQFEYVDSGSSTITITNPTLPTFTIDNGGVTLDRSIPDEWDLEAVAGVGVTITAFDWLVNGVSTANTQLFTLIATDPATNLGANTLTLFVQIDGMWYSDSFVFQVVEN